MLKETCNNFILHDRTLPFLFRFPCGRWLGKGADDGALERLLVAESVPPSVDANGISLHSVLLHYYHSA